jgi:hypothetical protein
MWCNSAFREGGDELSGFTKSREFCFHLTAVNFKECSGPQRKLLKHCLHEDMKLGALLSSTVALPSFRIAE